MVIGDDDLPKQLGGCAQAVLDGRYEVPPVKMEP
jgi:hypothetical protein